ncbi:Os01g0362300 [Oryza sativa Japonica Group]|uniref:Os01g0362300 protein n=1 Tax=Oryza sativa subsp. japonica TaxID=39947 RepID=A0A0P0V2L9_ORYSJ|nr:Os01g0362300 [Oryza sativa Japonica Group]
MTAETREAAADATAAHGGCGWLAGIAAGMASSAMAQPATSMMSAWSVAGGAGVARQSAQQEVKLVEMETGEVAARGDWPAGGAGAVKPMRRQRRSAGDGQRVKTQPGLGRIDNNDVRVPFPSLERCHAISPLKGGCQVKAQSRFSLRP